MTEENTNVKKVGVDPGWNDPPMLSTPNVQPATKRSILNKRVAFPLFGGSGTTAATTDRTGVNLNSTPPRPPLPPGSSNSAMTPPPLGGPPQ